ncbi:MAG: hypothetical protein ACYC0V_04180 [Armatimonadota bacterium]
MMSIDDYLDKGMYLAGYLGYEAGLTIDKPISQAHASTIPLAWFGIYTNYFQFDSETLQFDIEDSPQDIRNIRLNINEDEYIDSLTKIKDYIAAGDVFADYFPAYGGRDY